MNNYKKKIRDFLPVVNMWGTIPTHAMSIQTEDFKYIYWPYEGNGMKSAEELYDKNNDVYEKVNLVRDKKYKKTLSKMRAYYDEQVIIIKRDGVNYNKYDWYKTYFDRNFLGSEKEPILMKSAVSNYRRELKKVDKLKDEANKKLKKIKNNL